MARRVLIVGGAGFIGSHTAEALLQAGHRVRVLDGLDPEVHGPSGTWPAYLHAAVERRKGDVRDPDALARALDGIDAVYHLAARTSTARSMYRLQDYLDVNVSGTAALWDAVGLRGGVERVVLGSSRAVYGEGAHLCPACGPVAPPGRSREQLDQGRWNLRCPLCGGAVAAIATDERQEPKPQSIYATTKLFQEQLAAQAARGLGVGLVILRYFNVYGPRQAWGNPYTGIANVFFSRRQDGLPIHLFEDGLPTRDFVSVRDVARANLLALDAPAPGGPVNIGSGVATTIRAMAEAVCAGLGVAAAVEVTGWSRLGDIRSCFADTRLARQALGFEAEVALSDGVAELARWIGGEPRSGEAYRAMLKEIQANGILRRSAGPASEER